jgi:hypothetical protein
MKKERPDADAPTPQAGVEQAAADQAAKHQQQPEEPGVLDTIVSTVDGVTNTVGIAADILSIFG